MAISSARRSKAEMPQARDLPRRWKAQLTHRDLVETHLRRWIPDEAELFRKLVEDDILAGVVAAKTRATDFSAKDASQRDRSPAQLV